MSSSSSPAMPSTPAIGSPHARPASLPQVKQAFSDAELDVNRRQRIQMACQHCRHRKIRCCGGSPCNNCHRIRHECVYKAVPEEVNRATREKKLAARASKAVIGHMSTGSLHTPYFADQQVFEAPYLTTASPLYGQTSQMQLPHTPSHHRVHSHPIGLSPALPYDAHSFHSSPARMDSNSYMFTSPEPAPQIAFPSVLEGTPDHARYLQQQNLQPLFAPLGPISPASEAPPRSALPDEGYFSSSSIHSAWSTPGHSRPDLLLPPQSYSAVSSPLYETPSRSSAYRTAISPISTPNSHYSPYLAGPPSHHTSYPNVPGLMPAPNINSPVVPSPMYAPAGSNNSPTLAPELSLSKNMSLMGLGISVSTSGYSDMPLSAGPASAPPTFWPA